MGDGWSIAWRVLDAQFWGVPQRRRRISLIADFGGKSAPEILFVRKGVSGNIVESKPKGKETSPDAPRGTGADNCYCYDIGEARLRTPSEYKDLSPTLTSRCGTGGNNTPAVVKTVFSKSKRAQSDTDYETWQESDTANTLNAFDTGDVRTTEAVVYSLQGSMIGRADKNGPQGDGVNDDVSFTLNTIDRHGVVYALDRASYNQGKNAKFDFEVSDRYIVRRLTPLECERLQGFPDGWTDIGEWVDSNGKKHQASDAARYKCLGNSISLPPWKWILKRICACYERDATMASLFDGIGGFPYLWEQLNGKGSCLWASEIEEFPIAVTKVRIGE